MHKMFVPEKNARENNRFSAGRKYVRRPLEIILRFVTINVQE